MKKMIFFFFGVFAWGECSALEPFQWNDTLMPDFRLVIEPVMFNDVSGAAALFEAGRQNYRANGTIGYAFDEGYLGKISGEYLTQKLGLSFCSKHEHHWVQQGAVGAALLFPFNVECGFSYSHSDKKSLLDTVVPLQNIICEKRIVGSDGFRLFCGSEYMPWDSGILTGKLVYDYLKFNRTFQKDKVVQGVGFNLSLDQYLFDCAKIHLGVDLEAPFIAYDASLSTRIYLFHRAFDVGIYGQRVHGLKSIPSSSRVGIEIGINLENFWSGEYVPCGDSLFSWLSRPAVYMPQVLVIEDHKARDFGGAPFGNLPSSVTFTSENVNFDLSHYFIGTTPIVYEAITLPSGLTLHPISGKITGVIAPGSYDVIIKATNYFGTHSQLVTFNYPG
jgi:hypothetical protein